MNNAELIKALRCKSNDINNCTMCAYHKAYAEMMPNCGANMKKGEEK